MKRWLMVVVASVVMILPTYTMADDSDTMNESNKLEIDIKLDPSDVLFNINNFKPGDWAPRTIVVQNAGMMDFSYQMSMENKGEEKLFNELLLEINDNGNELYSGKLSEFENLPVRPLKATSEEELNITVTFPEHLGNEFQGTNSEFSFIFTAEGSDDTDSKEQDEETVGSNVGSDGSNGGGSILPDTATGIFNLLLIGSVLVVGGIFTISINWFRKRYKEAN